MSQPPDEPATLSASRRGILWGLLAALAVLLLGVSSGEYQRGVIDRNAEANLTQRADTVRSAAAAEVSRYFSLATVVADGLESFDTVTESNFRSLTSGMDEMGLDGATGVVFVAPPVASAEVALVQRQLRKSFAPDLVLEPDATRDEHLFALVFTSLDGSPDRPGGLDLSVAPAPYAALMEARRSGSATVSDAYQLVIDQQLPERDRQTSFVLVEPVSTNGEFIGWVLMGLRGQDFLGQVLGDSAGGTVDVVLEADDVAGADTQVATVPSELDGDAISADRQLQVAQHEWTLEVAADYASLVGQSRHMPRNSMIAGCLLALLAGSLVWLLVSGRERSAQRVRRATADLAAAELISRGQASMLDAMVETIDEVGVSIVDAQGRFVLQSRAAREILGIDETVASAPAAFPDDPEEWQENFGLLHLDGSPVTTAEMPLVRALAGESTDQMPMYVRNSNRPEGTQIEMSGRPLALGDGQQGALAVFRDVTQERRQQAELAGFAGVVAHDLRHPLTVIGGYIGMLTDHCLPDLEGDPALLAETATYLAKATAGTARMDDLISNLLEYTTARDAELTWASVDLNALAQEAAAPHLDAGGDAALVVPHIHLGDLPVIEADVDRLRQLFANLIGNAVKYVAPGTAPLLDVSASEQRGRVQLRFADRGIGIATEKSGEVFRPFVRAHAGASNGATYTGTGLGLAICHQVVQRHGGEISVDPNPGGGSVFTVELPLTQDPSGTLRR